MRSKNDKDIDAIIILSGDGLLSEILNGLSQRTKSIEEYLDLVKRIPLAILPAGSKRYNAHLK